jgi:hypothetical protein
MVRLRQAVSWINNVWTTQSASDFLDFYFGLLHRKTGSRFWSCGWTEAKFHCPRSAWTFTGIGGEIDIILQLPRFQAEWPVR